MSILFVYTFPTKKIHFVILFRKNEKYGIYNLEQLCTQKPQSYQKWNELWKHHSYSAIHEICLSRNKKMCTLNRSWLHVFNIKSKCKLRNITVSSWNMDFIKIITFLLCYRIDYWTQFSLERVENKKGSKKRFFVYSYIKVQIWVFVIIPKPWPISLL